MDTELKINTRNVQHKVSFGQTQGECIDFDLNSYLFFYSFCSMYLQCLWGHNPAITPKYFSSTNVTWSVGLIRTTNMVISSCHLKATNGLKNAPEAISGV